MTLKTQEINGKSSRKGDARGPGAWGSPRIPFLTAFTIDFLRFEGHFCCPVWVLRRDSFWGRVWYGKPTNLIYGRVFRPKAEGRMQPEGTSPAAFIAAMCLQNTSLSRSDESSVLEAT